MDNDSISSAAASRVERLSSLYEGILTAIVRVQSGRQQIQGAEAFRNRMKDALREIGQVAARRGYPKQAVEEANFAVVAFLDETVLSSHGIEQAQWARKSLQEELFAQRSAGESFFKHLDELRAHHDSPQLAEVLEVYYYSLLLGYEGRYAAGSKAELHIMMDNLRERIELILGPQMDLSPDWVLPDAPRPAPPPDLFPRQLRLATLAALAFALLCFVGFSAHLRLRTNEVERIALQQTALQQR